MRWHREGLTATQRGGEVLHEDEGGVGQTESVVEVI